MIIKGLRVVRELECEAEFDEGFNIISACRGPPTKRACMAMLTLMFGASVRMQSARTDQASRQSSMVRNSQAD